MALTLVPSDGIPFDVGNSKIICNSIKYETTGNGSDTSILVPAIAGNYIVMGTIRLQVPTKVTNIGVVVYVYVGSSASGPLLFAFDSGNETTLDRPSIHKGGVFEFKNIVFPGSQGLFVSINHTASGSATSYLMFNGVADLESYPV